LYRMLLVPSLLYDRCGLYRTRPRFGPYRTCCPSVSGLPRLSYSFACSHSISLLSLKVCEAYYLFTAGRLAVLVNVGALRGVWVQHARRFGTRTSDHIEVSDAPLEGTVYTPVHQQCCCLPASKVY